MLTQRRVTGLVAGALVMCMLSVAFIIGRHSIERQPALQVVHPSWVADFTDRDNIVKYYDNIYVAVVQTVQPANTFFPSTGEPSPGTKYTVKVLNSLKGELAGRMKIYQFGGFTTDGDLELSSGDSLLQEGRKYLIASSNTGNPDGQVMLSTYGHTDLSALSPSEQARAVRLMRAAIAAS